MAELLAERGTGHACISVRGLGRQPVVQLQHQAIRGRCVNGRGDILLIGNHPSIHLLYLLEPIPTVLGRRQCTPWTSRQFIGGPSEINTLQNISKTIILSKEDSVAL